MLELRGQCLPPSKLARQFLVNFLLGLQENPPFTQNLPFLSLHGSIFLQDSVMPSQEPQLDDKNDEADVPPEDTDGSEFDSLSI